MECSEIKLRQLNDELRIEAEYWKKENIRFNSIIDSINTAYLKDVAKCIIGPFGSAFNTDNYVLNGQYRYVRGQDVKPFILSDSDNRYMPKSDFERLSRYALQVNDILISVVGTLGNACLVQEKDLPALFSCKSTAIRVQSINPLYLLTYLNTKYGRELLLRNQRGAIQKGLNLTDLQYLQIPLLSDSFQSRIADMVKSAHSKLEESKMLYRQAEEILEKELGIDYDVIEQKKDVESSVRSFRDVSCGDMRIDSEYYKGKYDSYNDKIKTYRGGYSLLEKVCNVQEVLTTPSSNVQYKYIELANIGISGDIMDCTVDLGENLPSRARRKVKTGDILISSIEGSLQSCAIVPEKYNDSFCSTGFYVLEPTVINKETMLMIMKSKFIQPLLKRGCNGTILSGISKSEFYQIPIPLIGETIQTTIAEKVQTSFRLRAESKQLLEDAKRLVEEEIEKGGK